MSHVKSFRLALTAVLCLLGVFALPGSASAQTMPLQIRSISFPLIGATYLDDIPGWTPIASVIQQLQALGANDVKVTVSAGSYDTPLSNLPNPSANLNPSDDKILSFLMQLKAAGFQLTIFPFANINFDPNGNLLDSVHAQPTDFNAWIAAHTTAMVHFANIAQQVGAERFVVFGDEVQPLTYSSANQTGWLNMIAQIRSVYAGALTTVAWSDGTVFGGGNNQIDLTVRPIIDALDSIGIGWMPMPLTNTNSPSMAQLLAAWRKNVNGVDTVTFMQNVHAKYNKPVWISDIAFHSFSGDNVSSNDVYNTAVTLTADQQEQANEYDSLLTVLTTSTLGKWFLGVSADSWNRFPQDYTGTARYLNSAYGENIKGKLAETLLRQWYIGQRLSGENAGDYLVGGIGKNTLTGGDRNDTFDAHPATAAVQNKLTFKFSANNNNATTPSISVLVNGTTALSPTPITATSPATQDFQIDASPFGLITSVEIAVTGTTYKDQNNYSNISIVEMKYVDQLIDLSSGTYSNGAALPGNAYSNNGTVQFAASSFPASPFLTNNSDTIEGGGGFNTVLYRGPYANYAIASQSNGNLLVTSNGTAEGPDTLKNVQLLQFEDVQAIPVNQGWNLIGNSSGSALDVAATFSDAAKTLSVWKWVQSKNKWAFHSPTLSSQALAAYAATQGYDVLTTVNAGEGFWLNSHLAYVQPMPPGSALQAPTFLATGSNALGKGWSLVSTSNTITPTQFVSAVDNTAATIWSYDNPSGKWYFYAPSLDAQGGTALSDYITAHGYLDFATANKSLGAGVGFWVNKP